MRYTILAAMLLGAGLATPVMAAKKPAAPAPVQAHAPTAAPTWNNCFYLGWIRGVHVEQDELPDFMEQCLADKVPFGEDFEKYIKETSR